MNLDFREVLVCLLTVMVVMAASMVAVGAIVTYSYVMRTTVPAHQATYGPPVVVASAIDPCEPAFAGRRTTPVAETGVACPIYQATSG